MNRYEIILYWSDEDQAFIAEAPELDGCAADGPTRQGKHFDLAAHNCPEYENMGDLRRKLTSRLSAMTNSAQQVAAFS